MSGGEVILVEPARHFFDLARMATDLQLVKRRRPQAEARALGFSGPGEDFGDGGKQRGWERLGAPGLGRISQFIKELATGGWSVGKQWAVGWYGKRPRFPFVCLPEYWYFCARPGRPAGRQLPNL